MNREPDLVYDEAGESDLDDMIREVRGLRRAQRVENRQKMKVTGRSVFLLGQLAARPKRRRRARPR